MRPVVEPSALAQVRTRYRTGDRYFLHVGTLHPRKNLALLIDAFDQMVERSTLGSDVSLVLAGQGGWLREGIETKARRSGRVVLPGFVRQQDLAALYSGAIALVFPSLYEGFGLPILEAMSCDTPVICSNASSLPEVAGDAALLVDPHDRNGLARAMERIYHEPELRKQLIERGRHRTKIFSWDLCARQVMATLEVVGGGFTL
jgi:glycosyltransferase involved in cell wall biosynthesis